MTDGKREQPTDRHGRGKIQRIRGPPREDGVELLRMKGVGDKGGKTVELIQELCQIHEGRSDVALMAYQSYGGW